MQYTLSSALVSAAATVFASSVAWSASPMLGYLPDAAAGQRALEEKFDAQLNAADLREWLQKMSAEPTHVGAPHNKANAEFVQEQMRAWGWDAQIETFDVLYPTLEQHRLELLGPKKFVAGLQEPPIAGDVTSSKPGMLAPYHAYGADGDVTADLVYVNFGMPDDYLELARRNIDVKGKIVIVRYGGGWRGLKPKLAQQHGAVGCIIYSDPHEDGYFAGDVYPKGGWRPENGVQRGSVLDLPVAPGDPLTPGIGATKNAKRLSLEQATTILKIPVMPISYADAQPLLEALDGMVAPAHWRGSLPMTYHIGPGPAKVRLAIKSNWSSKPAYNVIAKIRGTANPDEWVLRGNHRDGWVFGAWDPLSAHVAMMAEAKAIGALLKQGWKPKRTLVYASWDAEEPGLLGSVEWAETHAEELKRKGVLYLNSDTNTRGFLNASGSHSLQRFVNEVAREVKDPQTSVSVKERLDAYNMVNGYGKSDEALQAAAKKAAEGADFELDALGSGSDFTPFIQHLGLTTLDVAYGGEDDQGGVYHSAYDSFDHYVRFGDPDFRYGVAEAQTTGRIILRMANASVLPMQFTNVAETLGGYLKDLHSMVDGKRKKSESLATLLEKNAFKLAADPTRAVGAPRAEPQVPHLNFAPMDNVLVRLQKSAQAYDAAYAAYVTRGAELSAANSARLNDLLRGLEQTLTRSEGLPGRQWYKHLLYAPGLLTGYGVKTLPGMREAIEDNRWDEANRYSVLTAEVLTRYCERLEQATAILSQK
jgi:N-acetylated-alpha-linked acidic dipeptidase